MIPTNIRRSSYLKITLQAAEKGSKKRMQEANSNTLFKKSQKDEDFFKKLHKVCVV